MPADQLTIEEQRLAQLNRQRQLAYEIYRQNQILQRRNRVKIIPGEIVEKMEKAMANKDAWFWPLVFICAIGVDLGIGNIPIVGRVIDLMVWAGIFAVMQEIGGHIRIKLRIMISTACFLEILPLIDLLPLWTLSIAIAFYLARKKGEMAEQALAKYNKGVVDKEAVEYFS